MPRRPPKRQRGFTLMELACVVAIIAALTSIAAPQYSVYRYRALAAEAAVNIETIAYLELVAILETGKPIACVANPPTIPSPKSTFDQQADWADLGFIPDGQVRYQYEVTTNGDSFVVTARGDLDQDGVVSTYTITSDTMTIASSHPGE